MTSNSNIKQYQGFEQGPIRPPSEASSLLLRLTRNCPWNRCAFCPVYKEQKFSLRHVDHILMDIDAVAKYCDSIIILQQKKGSALNQHEIQKITSELDQEQWLAFYAALNWINNKMESIFLQDANSLIIRPDRLIIILKHIKRRFPDVKRITSYARSHTIAKISNAYLKNFADCGLNRIHIGMESGSDKILAIMHKGVDQATHIEAGLKVKNAGMELSEYIMPGLGGKLLSEEHALESAYALNKINPDFIRLRTLAIPENTELYQMYIHNNFKKAGDYLLAKEILLFIQSLSGITSVLNNDHILNLFEEVQGNLPDDQEKMIAVIKRFLSMDPQEQLLYQVGRRTGAFTRLDHLTDHIRRRRAENTTKKLGVTTENIDSITDELIKKFI